MKVDVHKSNFDFTWYLLFIGNNETVYIVTHFFIKVLSSFLSLSLFFLQVHTNIFAIWPKLLEHVFSPAKNGIKSVVSIFCCSVSVGNISLLF